MQPESPITCSLSADELPVRLAEMTAVGDEALDSADVSGTRAVLRFRTGRDIRERLAAIVAAEAQCCAFLDMELGDDDEAIVLIVDAPAGAEPVVEELVESFRGGAHA